MRAERVFRPRTHIASSLSRSLPSLFSVLPISSPRGNVARFLNHACSPANNLSKQKVFTAPFVTTAYRLAFFAARDIRAGEELTYDYGYQVGAVKGQPIACHCASPACCGRLL